MMHSDRSSFSVLVPALQFDMTLGVWRSEDGEYRFASPAEQANVKAALAFLHDHAGSWATLALMTGMRVAVLRHAASRRGEVTADVALEVARLAGVPIERILAGSWPPDGLCARCGRISQ